MSKSVKISFIVLFVLVFLSLALNLYLIWYLVRLRNQALTVAREVKPVIQESLALADAQLETLQQETFTFEVAIDQELPVQAEIPFDETLEIPIQMNFPISETIETTIMMDPFQADIEIPVDIAVPVNLEVPIDVVVPIAINRTIPISTSIPVKLEVPIAIDVSETELVSYIESVRESLTSFNQWLTQTTEKFE